MTTLTLRADEVGATLILRPVDMGATFSADHPMSEQCPYGQAGDVVPTLVEGCGPYAPPRGMEHLPAQRTIKRVRAKRLGDLTMADARAAGDPGGDRLASLDPDRVMWVIEFNQPTERS